MAITYVGGGTDSDTVGTNSLSVSLPGGIAEDDVVVVSNGYGTFYTDPDINIALTTSGYTEIVDLWSEDQDNSPAYPTHLATYIKVMGATPDSTVACAGQASSDDGHALVAQVFRGVDTSTPQDASAQSAYHIDTDIVNPPSITTVTDDAVVVAAGVSGGGHTNMTGGSSGYSNYIDDGGEGQYWCGVGQCWKEVATAGAENPGAWTVTTDFGSDETAISVSMALRPATTAQNLTPSLYTTTNTFYTQTVALDAVDLTPSLFSDEDTFYTQVVNTAVDLTPSLYEDDDTFYVPVVGVGAIDLTPSLYEDGDTFYVPVVGKEAVDLTPSLFSDDDTFYVPVVGVGAVDLQPDLYEDGDTFYVPVVSGGSVDLQPDLYEDGDTFYVPIVSKGAVDLQPPLFADGDTFYTQVVGATVNLSPSLYLDADTFYAPTVDLTLYEIEAELFVNNQTYYTQDVSGGEPPSFGQDQGRLKVNIRRWRI